LIRESNNASMKHQKNYQNYRCRLSGTGVAIGPGKAREKLLWP